MILLRPASKAATIIRPIFRFCSSWLVLLLLLLVALHQSSTINAFSIDGSISMMSGTSGSNKSNHKIPKNIVVVGGGIQGTSVAFHLAQQLSSTTTSKITILEAVQPASAASGKGGGFMARSWGDGTPTQKLHELGFDLYEELAIKLNCASYRKLPVLSVTPGYAGISKSAKKQLGDIIPDWLDGKNIGRVSAMGYGDDTAQITPSEFVQQMLLAHTDSIQVVKGTCVGFEMDQASSRNNKKVTAVTYTTNDVEHQYTLPADAVVVSAGPWSCQVENWLHRHDITLQLPMEGIKSTSIVWKEPETADDDDGVVVDATALFCGEDERFGTHLEVYPRPDGTIYICGIGGSDYISTNDLKRGAFLTDCLPNKSRVQAAMDSFRDMSSRYQKHGELDKSQACMRPCPPDAIPYMGPVPGCDGVYINAGHNCWGIAWAPACGKAMAELVLNGECSCVNLAPFDPARFTTKTKNRGRKKQGVDVGEQW